MMVSLVPKQYVHQCWPNIEGFMEKAADYTYGRYHAEDIYDLVSQRDDYHLWVAFDGDKHYGAVVSNFVSYPNKRVLALQFCGGEQLALWKTDMLELLKRWARDTNCEAIESTGRKGWMKIFEDDGYKFQWLTYELPIGAQNG